MPTICPVHRPWLHAAARWAILLAAFAGPGLCSPAAAAQQAGEHPFAAPVAEAAQRFGIPELWIWRVMHAESRGNRRAVSRAGAMGLMQIMPPTWAMLTARHRLGNDPFDVRANILAGAAYLRAMWDRYGDVRLMLAAYNAGPGRADAYAAGRRGLPAETIAYVQQIAPELGVSSTVSRNLRPVPAAPTWRDASPFVVSSIAPPVPQASSETAIRAPADAAPAARPEQARSTANALFAPLSGGAE